MTLKVVNFKWFSSFMINVLSSFNPCPLIYLDTVITSLVGVWFEDIHWTWYLPYTPVSYLHCNGRDYQWLNWEGWKTRKWNKWHIIIYTSKWTQKENGKDRVKNEILMLKLNICSSEVHALPLGHIPTL